MAAPSNSATCHSLKGTAKPGDLYWLASIKHQGTAAFNHHPSTYTVFRNVKNFGAKGDSSTDDTVAINNAISSGNRCGNHCDSTSVSPALVYFPPGTYIISGPIIALYQTELVGDARNIPTIKASSNFTGIALIDTDPYTATGQYYVSVNNFYRTVRNFILDTTSIPAGISGTGIHWQLSQGTSLYNIVVNMNSDDGTKHQGIFMENGSGGFMGDLVLNGGLYGIWVGNQQFTVRNITVNNAKIGVHQQWNWVWTYQGVKINNCGIGFELQTGGTTTATQTAGAETIIDATITNTPIFIQTTTESNGSLAGSILLDNIHLSNVPTAVQSASGIVYLAGSSETMTIQQWAQGNVYSGTGGNGKYIQANVDSDAKPVVLLSGGKVFGRGRPQYEDLSVNQVISVKSHGAKGDGQTDDTKALQAILNKYAGCKLIFFDAGTYLITDTLNIPPNTRMTGEAWTQILIGGSKFKNIHAPHVGLRISQPGQKGVFEMSDFVVSTRGPAPGAIVMEWNLGETTQGSVGAWDTVIRLGSALGTNMGSPQCPTTSTPADKGCYAAFLAIHLTKTASAYLEGLWVWLGDHDLDNNHKRVTVFSGRGLLSESTGPVWMVGTASEHHVQYQYSLVGAKNHYMGLIQTETPYYQPSPAPPTPYPTNKAYHDPPFIKGNPAAWGLNVKSSSGILVYGAGMYSFFQDYTQQCLTTLNCQNQIANIDGPNDIQIYSLSTIGTKYQLSVSGKGVIHAADNRNGFQQTATIWRPSEPF